jgi:hypothetical protein
MKKSIPFFLALILFILTGFDDEPVYYGPYKPVFMLRSEMEKNVKLEGPKSILNPGKIYLKDHLIFINEKYRGIHVIDNTNPEDPTNIAFINVDGCIDMAMKNNVLYADNAVDLVALKLDDHMTGIEVAKRIKNTFPEPLSPEGRELTWKERQAAPEEAILVRWDRN